MSERKFEKLTVYSSTWCPDCTQAKRFLAEHEVEYELIEIDKTPGAAEKLEARTGKRGIPYFLINDEEWVQAYIPTQGFDRAGMKELLGL